jgi:hypothetical protein
MSDLSKINDGSQPALSGSIDSNNIKVKNGKLLFTKETRLGGGLPGTKLDSRIAIAYKLFTGFGFSMAAIGMVVASLPICAIGVATGILFAILSAKADKIDYENTIEKARSYKNK